jgi:hypothetical protein
VVFGFIKAALGPYKGEIFVLVNPEKVTVESFAQTIKLVSGPLDIEYRRGDDNINFPSSHFDIEHTKEKLGFSPRVTLAEGVSSFIHYYRVKEAKERQKIENEQTAIQAPVSLTSDQPTVKVEAKKGVNLGLGLRIAIFLFSLILLIITIVYPLADLSLRTYWGKTNLEKASKSLESDFSEQTISLASSAENNFHSADIDLQNVGWLLKIVGLTNHSANLSHLLWASENLSVALRNMARANQIVVATLKEVPSDKRKVESNLKETETILKSSLDKLEEAELVLDRIDFSLVPSVISPSREFLVGETVKLQRSVEDLVSAIETILNKSSR